MLKRYFKLRPAFYSGRFFKAKFMINQEEKNTNSNTPPKKSFAKKSAAYIAKIAILAAFGVVLLYIEFPILPAVPFLKLNISDCPALIASFMFGPISGVIVNALKVGLCLLLRGTSTGFVGDISNLISGSLYAIIAGVIYYIKKDKTGALLALILSSVVFCGAMLLCNAYMLFPFFGITDKNTATSLLWWTLLFNAIKCALTSFVTFYVYKHTRRLFNKIIP